MNTNLKGGNYSYNDQGNSRSTSRTPREDNVNNTPHFKKQTTKQGNKNYKLSERFGGNAKLHGIRGNPHKKLTMRVTRDGRRVNQGLPIVAAY